MESNFVSSSPVRWLMMAVIQEADVERTMSGLSQIHAPVVYLSSTGGFLGRRNATLLIGILEEMEERTLQVLQKSCRQRVEYLAIPLEGSTLPLPTPVPITVGGATIFVLPVERFEEF